jgi:glutamyl-tRNA synthetase
MAEKNKAVRTRFAPSPTGSMHIGNLRTAFYAYAMAKHYAGDFILRIEDTDKKRETEGGVQKIKDLLQIFKIDWDEYYLQSERLPLYRKAAEKLLVDGNAFYCQCEAKNIKAEGFSKVLRDPCRDKNLSSGAIKLKVPEDQKLTFRDFVLGEDVSWESAVVFDATLLKTDGFPTYHLAVVVDDIDMKVSHVLRGHDWLPSTPIHLLVYKFLGFPIPEIGHLSDIMDPDGGKLSKRKGSTSVEGFLKDGYLPEALFNFVILAGWAPKDNREFFTLEEFVKYFDEKGLQKANPIFNRVKLDWFNQQYIQKLEDDGLATKLNEFFDGKYDQELLRKISPLVKSRIKTLSEFERLAGFFFEAPSVDSKLFGDVYQKHLEAAVGILEKLTEWKLEKLNDSLMAMIKEKGFRTGEFFMSLRIAITGQKFTPPINESMEIFGKEKTLKRLKSVLNYKQLIINH